jgi:hypothetical protein
MVDPPAVRRIIVRFSLLSFALGVGAYWAFQHFTGMGNTGKGSR